jgi:hypothetical protein
MNLEQLKAKYANNTTVKGNDTTMKNDTACLGMSKFGRKANKAWEATKDTTKAAATVVGRVMPATNGKVDDIAAKFNNRLNNVEMKQRAQDVKIAMLAQLVGADMPTDEEIVEALMEEDKAEEEAKAAEEVLKQAEAVAPMMEKMMEMFTAMFGKDAAPVVKDEEIVETTEEEEIVEVFEPDVVEQPKAGGRRRIKRGAPLAD